MKQLFTFTWIVCLSLAAYSQLDQQLVDSLTLTLNEGQADTMRVLNLIHLARLYEGNYEHDSVLRYGYETLNSSRSLAYYHGIGSGHRDLAITFWNQGMLDSALVHSELSIQAFQLDNDQKRIHNQKYLKGMIMTDYGRFDEALALHYAVLTYFEATENPNITAVLNSIGYVQNLTGNYAEAESAYQQAIEVARQNQNEDALANAMSNLGSLYSSLGRLEEALTLFEQVLEYDQRVKNDWGIGFQMINIGSIHVKKGEYKQALTYQLQGLSIRRKLGQKIHLCSNLLVIGRTYKEMKASIQALVYYEEAKEIAEEIDARDYLYSCHLDMSACYANLSQYEAAYEYRKTASVLRDSIYAQEKLDKIQELTKRYENEKKEATIALLSAENQLKDVALTHEANVRKGLILGLILMLIIGLLIWAGEKRRIRNQKLLTEKNQQIRETAFRETLTNLELKALRAQMNPHFIFNCMNSINRLILEGQNDKASRNLTKFARLIRMILEYSEKKNITLAEELQLLETYIQLEAERFKNKIAYEIQVAEQLDPEEIELPSMILQPFVENAIWHGLMHKEEGGGKILIQIEARDTLLHCYIEDNGVGREKALELKNIQQATHTSMAMTVTKERLKLLDSTGLTRLIKIIDLKDVANQALGTRVELNIPLS
ncbi:MAG: tetratricopeptide repeat protein [Bacteroidota bacterium]